MENSQFSRPWDEFLWEVRRWFGIGLVYSASRLVFHLQKLVYDRDPGQENLQTWIIKDLCLSCQTARIAWRSLTIFKWLGSLHYWSVSLINSADFLTLSLPVKCFSLSQERFINDLFLIPLKLSLLSVRKGKISLVLSDSYFGRAFSAISIFSILSSLNSSKLILGTFLDKSWFLKFCGSQYYFCLYYFIIFQFRVDSFLDGYFWVQAFK